MMRVEVRDSLPGAFTVNSAPLPVVKQDITTAS